MRWNGWTGIARRYRTLRVVLTPGAKWSTTWVSLTAVKEPVHSDRAIQPKRNCFCWCGSPTIFETVLTLIFMMRQRAFHWLIFICRQPILRIWLFATCRPPDYPRFVTNNRWRSIDTHLQDVAGSVWQSVWSIKAANNSFVTACNLLAVWIPRMHNQKLLILCWRSFSRCARESLASIFTNKCSQYFDSVSPQTF